MSDIIASFRGISDSIFAETIHNYIRKEMKENYPYASGIPVSAIFYSRIRQRVNSIFVNLGGRPEPAHEKEVMHLINVHLGVIAHDNRRKKSTT